MHTSSEGIEIMHYFEDCKLLAYPDPGSDLFKALRKAGIDPYNILIVPPKFQKLSGKPWTIAWGDAGDHVKPGDRITQEEADERFARRLTTEFEPAVNKAITRTPKQCEFDAFVSFAYNAGLGNFTSSTALRRYNLGDVPAGFEALTWWNKANGKVMKGLQRRRAAEKALGLGQTAKQAIATALKAFP